MRPALSCGASVIAEGLRDPSDLGSIYRLMACFGVGELVHTYQGDEAPTWDDEHRALQLVHLEHLAVGSVVEGEEVVVDCVSEREAHLEAAVREPAATGVRLHRVSWLQRWT